jgi:hypothetical protein
VSACGDGARGREADDAPADDCRFDLFHALGASLSLNYDQLFHAADVIDSV